MADDNPYAPPNAPIQLTEKVFVTSIKTWPSICRWIAGFVLIAFLIGVVGSRLTRPVRGTEVVSNLNLHSLFAFGAMIGVCVALVARFWRFPLRDAILAIEIGFFCVWLAEYFGWSIDRGDINDDVLFVTLIRWLASATLGTLLMMIPHQRHMRNPYDSPSVGNDIDSPQTVKSPAPSLDGLSSLCVLFGFVIILGGVCLSIALRNPGGPAVSNDEWRRAQMVFHVAFGVGAAVAILIPAVLLVVRRVSNRSV